MLIYKVSHQIHVGLVSIKYWSTATDPASSFIQTLVGSMINKMNMVSMSVVTCPECYLALAPWQLG